MAKIMVKCHYLKSGDNKNHLSNLVKYMSTRDGVEVLKVNEHAKASDKQIKLIQNIVKEFPSSKKLDEYKDFEKSNTIGTASEFITRALEENYSKLNSAENYVDYIANRPKVEKINEHGLFTSGDKKINLNQVTNEIKNHKGNIWTPIISLKREDAIKTGFDNAESWHTLLSEQAMEMAKLMKIPLKEFRWYGAFHNESHHPHVHMVCYSADEKSGYVTEQAIKKMKSLYAKKIFENDLNLLYKEKTEQRDKIKLNLEKVFKEHCENPNEKLESLIYYLSEELKTTKGKKQYGYLPPRLKSVVDEIVNELAQNKEVAKTYDLWCETQNNIVSIYNENLIDHPPLSQQPEFKSIKNMIIKEVSQLNLDSKVIDNFINVDDNGTDYEFNFTSNPNDEIIFEYQYADDENHKSWSDQYKLAKKYLYGDKDNNIEKDLDKAFKLMTDEANTNNALAIYDLATFYTRGIGTEKDLDKADELYSLALSAFKQLEDINPDKSTQYKIGKMYSQGLGTEKDISDAINWLTLSSNQGYKYAQYSLASIYHKEESVVDITKAFELYKLSADQDFCYAQYEVGKMFKDGNGTEVDEVQSQEYFAKAFANFVAMEKQNPDDKLQYRLGCMYRDGIGTQINIEKAIEYFEKAAYVGNDQAIYSLAKIYLSDELGYKDLDKGLFMLKTSANNGNEFAQYKLGALFFRR